MRTTSTQQKATQRKGKKKSKTPLNQSAPTQRSKPIGETTQQRLQRQGNNLESAITQYFNNNQLIRSAREGNLNWNEFISDITGKTKKPPYNNQEFRKKIFNDFFHIYADYHLDKTGEDVRVGINEKFDEFLTLTQEQFTEMLQDDQKGRLLQYLRYEYINGQNSSTINQINPNQGIELSFGKAIINQQRRNNTNTKIRLRDFNDPNLNLLQREMLENRISLLTQVGDMDAIENFSNDILNSGQSLSIELQNKIFGNTAQLYAQQLRTKAQTDRDELIKKLRYINTAGEMPDKSSEYRFLYKDVTTVEDMQQIINNKLGTKGTERYNSLTTELSPEIALVAARDLALMSNDNEIFDGFIAWVKNYQTQIDSQVVGYQELKDEVTIMAMMNQWYKDQEQVTVYRALAIDDDTAQILQNNGIQSQASFSAPTDTSKPIADYDEMTRNQPLADDIKRKTKSDQFISQSKTRPFPRRTYLLPVGVTADQDSGALSKRNNTNFDIKTRSDASADLSQSITFHPEVAKTVASNPDFTGSTIPNFVMFTLKVPRSAIIKPNNIDPGDIRDLVPLNSYIQKRNEDDLSQQPLQKLDLTKEPAFETESWIYGNIPSDWIVGYQNITNDAYEIDSSDNLAVLLDDSSN